MIIVETETGSQYRIDLLEKTWERIVEPSLLSQYPLRDRQGTFYEIEPLEVGQPLRIVGPPYNPKMSFRYIRTSPVVRITSPEIKMISQREENKDEV